MSYKNIINKLIEVYNSVQPCQYKITRWPDEKEREQRACDAWSEAPAAVPLAIEHTKVETFSNRYLDDARFLKVFGPLETEFKNYFPYAISLWLPTFAVRPGLDWDSIRASLRKWLLENVQSLPERRSQHSVPGLTFQISVYKRSKGPNWFMVGRMIPTDLNEKAELAKRWSATLTNKDEQLRRYREAGARTLLLAESDDIALVDIQILYMAFLCAQSKTPTPNIDEIWMVYTYHPEYLGELMCLSGPEQLMSRINPPNLMLCPQHLTYWERALKAEGWC